jgi:hypothetical protein
MVRLDQRATPNPGAPSISADIKSSPDPSALGGPVAQRPEDYGEDRRAFDQFHQNADEITGSVAMPPSSEVLR